jgi:MFS family permease
MAQDLTIRNQQDVVDIINDHAPAAVPLPITLIALGGIMIDAYQAAMIGFGNKYIAAQFGISQGLAATVNASVLVSALIGGLAAKDVIERLGQQKAFIFGLGLCTIGALAVAFASSVWQVLVWRVVMGFGLGIDFPLATNSVAEMRGAKAKKSSTSVNLWQMAWYISTTIVFIVLILLNSEGTDEPLLWRHGIFIGGIFALLVMILRFKFIGESAMWAARHGKFKQARDILAKRYRIEAEVAPDAAVVASDSPSDKLVISTSRCYAMLFSKRYCKRTVLGCVVATMQAWQYNAVGVYLPLTLGGILGNQLSAALGGSAVVNALFGITGGAIGSFLVTKFGSRRLSGFGFAMVAILLVVLGLTSQTSPWMSILLLGLIIFFHSSGPGGLGMTIATMSYPPCLRPAGIGFARAIMRSGAIAGLILWPILWGTFKIDAFYYLALVPLVGCLTCLFINWEAVGYNVDAEDEDALKELTANK